MKLSITILLLISLDLLSTIDAISINLSPQQLSKLESCSNDVYDCIKNALDEYQVYCCCKDTWNHCKRMLACDNGGRSKNLDNCRFLSTYEIYFKRYKNKNCSNELLEQCNAGLSINQQNNYQIIFIIINIIFLIWNVFI